MMRSLFPSQTYCAKVKVQTLHGLSCGAVLTGKEGTQQEGKAPCPVYGHYSSIWAAPSWHQGATELAAEAGACKEGNLSHMDQPP